ncbi:hypothetical protein BC834DRAFT_895858 [Gloeopeniophorella convolvens]|nr:hypothetical protein BC834DRAFT_895858 [Gloeopeniophorella convolvens]
MDQGKRKSPGEGPAQPHDGMHQVKRLRQPDLESVAPEVIRSLPPIANLLRSTSFPRTDALRSLSYIILDLLHDKDWGGVLDSRLLDLTRLRQVVKDHDLIPAIEECIDTGKWEEFFEKRPYFFNPDKLSPPSKDILSRFWPSQAWKVEYKGDRAQLLFETICEMMEHRGEKTHTAYVNIAAILQSSGYGKSRMVDEHAKFVFTFPFNLRSPNETKSGAAFPLPDETVREYFLLPRSGELDVRIAFLAFFAELFNSAASLLQDHLSGPRGGNKFKKLSEVALWWHDYLSLDANRQQFYASVVGSAKRLVEQERGNRSRVGVARESSLMGSASNVSARSQNPVPPLQSEDVLPDESKAARTAFSHLLKTLLGAVLYDELDPVKVIIYFDEAHELATTVPDPVPILLDANQRPLDDTERLLVDVLCSTLDVFMMNPMMILLLSTTSSFDKLAPSRVMARSARMIQGKTIDHAPITELPFDCHPSFPLDDDAYTLADISKLEFLSRFGRPLFWSLMGHSAMGDAEVIAFAKRKLDPTGSRKPSIEVQTAVIDLLMMLDYTPLHTGADLLQQELVAGHMRTVASVTQDRRIAYTGYPSEPLLAEAASSLLEQWRKDTPEIVIRLISEHHSNGLLDLGDAGELVARILLTLGYQEACRKEFLDSSGSQDNPTTYFSRGCKLKTFLECTFVNASLMLAAKPDNIGNDSALPSLESALGNAVVRFTHFSKWDKRGSSHFDAHSAFLRGTAIICKTNQKKVDLIIPILVRTDGKACPHVITALLIQVKRRMRRGSPSTLAIDEADIKFFPKEPALCQCCPGPLTSSSLTILTLPYISLVLDLGVEHTRRYVHLASPPRKTKPELYVSSAPQSLTTRSRSAPQNQRVHPRYAIYVGTCSPTQFHEIDRTGQEGYRKLLRLGHAFRDHPRQGRAHLRAVKELSLSRGYKENEQWLKRKGMPTESDSEEDSDAR